MLTGHRGCMESCEVSSEIESLFRAFLKQHSYQITTERLEIARLVGMLRRAFTVEELIGHLKGGGYRQSRGTIYSTVHLLAHAGLIVQLPQMSEAYYITSKQAQDYAVCICRRCGAKMLYRQPSRLKTLGRSATHRYRSTQPLLVFYGVCQHCTRAITKGSYNKRSDSGRDGLKSHPEC